MTRISIDNNIAEISYELEGFLKIASMGLILLCLISIVKFFDAKLMFYISLFGLFMFIGLASYNSLTEIDLEKRIINHRFSVFGFQKRKWMYLDGVTLVSKLHGSGKEAYPQLYFIDEDGEKAMIGEFFKQDMNIFIENLLKFYEFNYKKNF